MITEPADLEPDPARPAIAEPESRTAGAGLPLFVDLDGTLIESNLLWDGLRVLVRERPGQILRAPVWLAAGRARLKHEWTERIEIPVADLPYRREVVAYIEAARASGRRVVLASASPERWVRAVAEHLGLFDDVLATKGGVNLKAAAKRDAISAHLAHWGLGEGFEYVGDDAADLEIWRAAGRATLAGGGARLERRVRDAGLPTHRLGRLPSTRERAAALLRMLRPHQWVKNGQLLLPLLLAHRVADVERWTTVLIAIATFCGIASGTYALNDVIDVVAYGAMLDEGVMREDTWAAASVVDTNFMSPLQILERVAAVFEAQPSGFICALNSVAGDRGRASNYIYGSTKAALQALLSGLRARLGRSGVSVVDVRPGFVDTGLTWGRPGVFLAASPDRVARDLLRGLAHDRAVVYTPSFWWAIMAVIRLLPDRIFNRLSL